MLVDSDECWQRSQATEESSDMPFPMTQPCTKTALVDSATQLADPGKLNEEEGRVPGGDKKVRDRAHAQRTDTHACASQGTDPGAEGETDDEDGDELAVQIGAASSIYAEYAPETWQSEQPAAQKRVSKDVVSITAITTQSIY